MVKSTEKGDLNGAMVVFLQETSTTITLKEKELMNGMMADAMRVTGKIIRWMVKEYSLGLTVENMKGSIRKI
jgi:thiamine phosphate synthase YjbQ (UPF0047 family)